MFRAALGKESICGRVRLSSDYSEIKIRLKFAPDAAAPNFEVDWNKPPTAPMLVALRSEDGKRIPRMMRWGLLPHWARAEKIGYSTFNARSEDFRTKPAFRDAWRRGQRRKVKWSWPAYGRDGKTRSQETRFKAARSLHAGQTE